MCQKLLTKWIKVDKSGVIYYIYNMINIVGTYECKADDKGRIMLPMSLKKQLSDKLKNGFVIKRAVFNECLELYPLKEWDSLMERINNLNRFNKKNIDFIRRFTAGVRQIDIDISGRILIPKDLINHAKIKNNIFELSIPLLKAKYINGNRKLKPINLPKNL